MRKIAFYILGILITGSLLWYLFLKPFDYLVTFKANTYPGTTGQELKFWAKSLKNTESVNEDKLNGILIQKLKFGDSIHTYEWKLTALNDSITKVKVYVTDKANSFQNKLAIPFSETEFEKRSVRTVTDFMERLNEHIGDFKISSVDTAEIAPNFCAFISVKTTQMGKASKMMYNFPILNGFLAKNKFETAGAPFIEITKWDRSNDSITYDFCYPIVKLDSLPTSPLIKYKDFKGVKGLKAIYNGNYITSDRAWYALLGWAKNQGVEVIEKPIEIFHSNPNFGGNELEWKAEVFMPLK